MYSPLRALLIPPLLLLASSALAADPGGYKLDGHQVVLEGTIEFEPGGAALKPSSTAALEVLVRYLGEKSYVSRLRIEGHTDDAGDPGANQKLSEARALELARWLVARGVDCKRLLPVGFGSTKPVAGNDTPEGRAQNRRVAFVNAELKGRAIGGMPIDGGGRVAGDPCAR